MKVILSIDGGGIRGILPATLLAELEIVLRKDIASMFDLIVGTSTGSLIAALLTKESANFEPEYTGETVLRIYENDAKNIFTKEKSLLSMFGLLDNKYSSKGIKSIADKYLGSAKLGESLTPVMITAYDIENREAVIFKSWKDDHKEIPVSDCVMASTAAPTYFEPVMARSGDKETYLIDGGVFANNPSLVALAEARDLWPHEKDFAIVSLGTGYITESIKGKDAAKWGVAEWARPILSILFDGQTHTADYIASKLCADYYRADGTLDFAKESMDDASQENIFDLCSDGVSYSMMHIDCIIDLLKRAGKV